MIDEHPSFDSVMQSAIEILREYVTDHKEYQRDGSAAIFVTRVLTEKGFSNTDAQRTYAGLKRLELIVVVKNGRSFVAPTIKIEMNTSVTQRRIEKAVSHKLRRRLTGTAAELAAIDMQIEQTEALLKKLHRDRGRVEAKMRKDNSVLQPQS